MFIRKSVRKYKDKTYTSYLLVESISTPEGPRQKTICSLGDLSPGPKEKWLGLVQQVEANLRGQVALDEPDPIVAQIVDKIRSAARRETSEVGAEVVAVHTDGVTLEEAREVGCVHVGHQMWLRLGLEQILREIGMPLKTRWLSEAMVLNRLVAPCSEHAMPNWIRTTALGELLQVDFSELSDEALYRNLDQLHPNRQQIETALAEREKTLFNLDDSYYLYDLTSTYFEGQCRGNPKAKRGYSRDQRPDCKQVVVGLVLDRDGFPKAHEVFEGNRQDRASLDEMLGLLEKRSGRHGGATVIVDRGMSYAENLEQIRARGHHYVVAGRPHERFQWWDIFEQEEGWQEIIRIPSPSNPAQRKSRVWVKSVQAGEHLHILCRSDGRKEKDQAIRQKQEQRLTADLNRLRARIKAGRLELAGKIHQAIGRLKERYPRVARYFQIVYDEENRELKWEENGEAKQRAARLDGTYLLKTDRLDLGLRKLGGSTSC